jgi:hypothetical protein
MIRHFETKAKVIDDAIEQLKEEKTANKILTVLRELAKKDAPLAEVRRTYNLLVSVRVAMEQEQNMAVC